MRSLRFRLFLLIFVAMFVIVPGMFFAGAGIHNESERVRAVAELETRLSELIDLRRDELSLRETNRVLTTTGQRLQETDLQGAARILPTDGFRRLSELHRASGATRVGGRSYLFAASVEGPTVRVLLRSYADELQMNWGGTGAAIAGTLGLACCLAVLIAWIASRSVTRPVAGVVEASRRLANEESPGLLPVRGPTELRQLTSSFNEMSRRLAVAREAERAFLSSVSHELRTPLGSVRGYAEALSEGAIEVREATRFILSESRRLERLVLDLLDLARLRQHRFDVSCELVDLRHVVGEAVQRHQLAAQKAGVSLRVDVAQPATACVDQDRLLQVLSNLVENAVRTAPAGSTVTLAAREGELSVADEGPGLADVDCGRIFEPFYLSKRLSGRRPVGSGLGLAVVKELVEAMGGSVCAESRKPTGVVFRVVLNPSHRSANELDAGFGPPAEGV